MLKSVMRKVEVLLCGACRDARGFTVAEPLPEARRSTVQELGERTAAADKVLVLWVMYRPVYLDYNVTTAVDPAVADAIAPCLRAHFGNPFSSHAYGRMAYAAVEEARAQVAALIGAHPEETVFTGCATEATNLAIVGLGRAAELARQRCQEDGARQLGLRTMSTWAAERGDPGSGARRPSQTSFTRFVSKVLNSCRGGRALYQGRGANADFPAEFGYCDADRDRVGGLRQGPLVQLCDSRDIPAGLRVWGLSGPQPVADPGWS